MTTQIALRPLLDAQDHAFLFGAVRDRAGKWPYIHHKRTELAALVSREMAEPDCRASIITLADDDEVRIGCLVTRPQRIVFAFVRDGLGGDESFRRSWVMTMALNQHGIECDAAGDDDTTIAVVVWTATASRIAAAGRWRIYPAIHEPRRKTT